MLYVLEEKMCCSQTGPIAYHATTLASLTDPEISIKDKGDLSVSPTSPTSHPLQKPLQVLCHASPWSKWLLASAPNVPGYDGEPLKSGGGSLSRFQDAAL